MVPNERLHESVMTRTDTRSHARQAAIRTLEERAAEPILSEHGQRNGQSGEMGDDTGERNSQGSKRCQDSNLGPTDYEPIQQKCSGCLCIAPEGVRDDFKKGAMLSDCSPYP